MGGLMHLCKIIMHVVGLTLHYEKQQLYHSVYLWRLYDRIK